MPYNIAMISDFFYPQPGGVESHIYQLSTKLIDRGHRVIIITHSYGPSQHDSYPSRNGIRYLTNRLKVYHLPHWVVYRSTTFPTVFSSFPTLRQIFIREQIEIVHGHASLSNLCHEGLLHARTMGLVTVFTDHSLFGFSDAASIMANKLLKFSLSDVGHVICVSHTCKENTTLRASLNPLAVSVIPNAVVPSNFKPLQPHEAKLSQLQHSSKSALLPPPPDPSQPLNPGDPITIVVISRLFYNKGTDLLISALPLLLRQHPNLRFIIAGSGPKAIDLEQTLDSLPQNLVLTPSGQSRVVLLGSIRHEEVRNIMVRAHLLLSTSLTEAFGTVLVEAASCGLMVVATRVGGVPEVLPGNMTVFVLPEVEDVVRGVGDAIGMLTNRRREGGGGGVRRDKFHGLVRNMYSWHDIARRTERVYDLTTDSPSAEDNAEFYDSPEWAGYGAGASSQMQGAALIDRLKRYYGCGIWAGKLFVIVVVVDYLIYVMLEFLYPRDKIDICKPWPEHRREEEAFKQDEDGRVEGYQPVRRGGNVPSMAMSTRSEFVDAVVPLFERLNLYDRTRPPYDQPQNDAADPTKRVPQGFIDAMTVREEVFVKEQNIPLENELDEDDARSFHWTAYASIPTKAISPEMQAQNHEANGDGQSSHSRKVSNSTKIPVGTIRLVPPPHPPHPTPGSHHQADALDVDGNGRKDSTTIHDGREAYIKLGRLAVIPEFRKAGISKLLIETALTFAKDNPYEMMPQRDPSKIEAMRVESDGGVGVDWKGLVLVHAQIGVQKVWKRYGFEYDEAMGTWDEEGIDHVGMWKRVDVEPGRRKSRPFSISSPPLMAS
ncbi:phosphatidylinositol glycan, class A [Hortaea werneckii]|nr:phosphatidylinositol glycan, class A [Hortaea werneckii]